MPHCEYERLSDLRSHWTSVWSHKNHQYAKQVPFWILEPDHFLKISQCGVKIIKSESWISPHVLQEINVEAWSTRSVKNKEDLPGQFLSDPVTNLSLEMKMKLLC